jgi:hypothetical protein
MREKPSFEKIMSTLERLQIKPPTWNFRVIHLETKPERKETSGYFVQIISNDLAWLSTDEEREKVWALASRRLAERSGRKGKFSFICQNPLYSSHLLTYSLPHLLT